MQLYKDAAITFSNTYTTAHVRYCSLCAFFQKDALYGHNFKWETIRSHWGESNFYRAQVSLGSDLWVWSYVSE